MSVVPVSPFPPSTLASDRREERAVISAKAESFEQNLARALAESGPEAAEKGKLLAEVLRLQLMRGAVLLDLEEGERDDPLTSSLLPDFSLAGRDIDPASFGRTYPPASVSNSESSSSSIDAIVERAARRYQVAPELVKAVIRAESGFNPRAISPAGAQGLMQLMPGTARDLGVSNAFDPEQNVLGGTRYLRQMLDRYDGDVERALAAYNWGPGNLDRSDGSLPRETREYVTRIKNFLSREV